MTPSIPSALTICVTLVVIGVVTIVLRWLPFQALRVLKGSELVGFLGRTMPVGVMLVLVAYTLAGSRGDAGNLVAAVVALAVTVAVHLWWRRPAVSVFGGTAVYMLLVNVVVLP